MRTYLNNDWQYFETFGDDIFKQGVAGETVRIPHCNKQTPYNCYDESMYQFVCGYKRNIHLENISGKKYLLTFEGVAHYAEVYVNGILVTVHRSGYTAFTADITNFVREEYNQVVVKVDARPTLNQPPFGNVIDYQTYGGIYRDVYLDEKEGTYVVDAFVKAEPNKAVSVDVTLGNVKEFAYLTMQILDGDNTVFSSAYTANSENVTLTAEVKLDLWSLDNPKLYVAKISVDKDVYLTTFGVRSAKFTKDGFFLNDRKVKIIGLNRHQSFPYVGYAMPESMQRRDARILKEQLAVNAVRTSHYPQSQYFIDECDKLGLLVFMEIPGWQHIGDGDWQAQAVANVEEMITQYRNHPSIVIWGVRINESADNEKLYLQTNAAAYRLDPTRPTSGVRYIRNSQLLEDVYAYNDFNRDGASDRNAVCPKNKPYLITEYNGHMYPTKTFDDAPHRLNHALRYAKMLDDVYAADKTCGCFGWCMFDYNTHVDFGSGDRICYHGVMDMFRNPKIASGVFSSCGKTPYLEAAFVADIGDYPEGVIDGMYCFTNASYIKVYKGNSFIKCYDHYNSPYKYIPNAPILIDDLIGDRLVTEEGISPKYSDMIKKCIADIKKYGLNFIPVKTKVAVAKIMAGTKLSIEKLTELYGKYESNWGSSASDIRIEAYEGDKVVASKVIGSPKGYRLDVAVSHTTLVEGVSYDVAAVNITARDQNGNVCPYVNKVVRLSCEGPIELIGDSEIALQGGMFGTYVKSVGKIGKAKLYVDGREFDFEVVRNEN